MTTWIIEPRDPLIVRDGRPFSSDPGAHASSLPFPFPSSTTGGVRTRAGLDDNGIFKFADSQGRADVQEQLNYLKQLRVRGPLLVQLTANSHDIASDKWLLPAPHDAFTPEPMATGEPRPFVQQLVPLEPLPDAHTDLDQKGLMLVGQKSYDEHKPLSEAPRYWYWNSFQLWLHDPSQLDRKIKTLSELGIGGLMREQRLHVSIDADKEVARDGMLFQTSGMEFTIPGKGNQRLGDAQRLALAVVVDDDSDFVPRPGLACFGGERRLVTWRKSNVDLPSCPADLEEKIIVDKACRIILLTPAHFEKGYHPTWLLKEATSQHKVRAQLTAIAIQRPQVVSGWDLALKKPKPSRRLAPAGTVFFLTIEGSDDEIRAWVRDTWMQCISDNEQDRIDGFGLAVFGSWSGRPVAMQKG